MLKYVSYDDIFEKVPIYTTSANIEIMNKQYDIYQHDSPLENVPYEYMLDFTILYGDIESFVILNENDKAYYTYYIMEGANILTYYADSIHESSTCVMVEREYGLKWHKMIIHEHEKVIVLFDFTPCGVIKLKHNSPIQFKTENDFQTFLNKCWHTGIDGSSDIEGFTIPLTNDRLFDATRSEELILKYSEH